MPVPHLSNKPPSSHPADSHARHVTTPMIPAGNVQVFVTAAQAVFDTMLGQPLTVVGFVPTHEMASQGVSVLISLNGPTAGTMILCLSYPTATKFVAALSGLEPTAMPEAVVIDGVCELVNMIAGAAKAVLDDTATRFEMTLPVSFVSDGTRLGVKAGMPGGVLQCEWVGETIQLGIWRARDI